MAFWSDLFSQPARLPLNARPSLTLFFLMVGAFLLTLVPQVVQLPPWVTLGVISAMVIRSILEIKRLPLPSSGFCAVMGLCLAAGVLMQYGTILGREAGMAFVAGLLAIKFFELRGPRDLALIIFACFFVVMSSLLYSQALELFVYCLIMMWVLTALLLRIQIGDQPADRLLQMLRRSGIVFLQALPLTVFLFFFFPRYPGKLQIPINEAGIGFTDTVAPGSIAALSQDNRKAMYVKFLGENVPTVETMYWRGLVLWEYHHGIWSRGVGADTPVVAPQAARHSSQAELFKQQITISAHFRKWLFALDYPIEYAQNAAENSDWSVMMKGDVLQLSRGSGQLDHDERYEVMSGPLAPQDLSKSEFDYSTLLPHGEDNDSIDPEVKALADRLRAGNPDDLAYVSAVLHYFRHNHFTYTDSPGAEGVDRDWLHVFLFEKKTGFCEHFASAFAVLMRLEKIPARLVVGYQGGEYNPYNNSYIVRQSNAHAWDEVWLKSKNQPPDEPADEVEGHWQRVDPTAILPPSLDAASSNGNQSDPSGDDLGMQASHPLTQSNLPDWLQRNLADLQLRRQQIESSWDDWVFSYDTESQGRLASALGFGRNPIFLLAVACLFAAGVCAMVFRIVLKRKQVLPPVENFYAAFCRIMAQSGVPRAQWEGPLAYTGRVAEAFPEREKVIRSVGTIVADARYGSSPVSYASKELESLLRSITTPQAAPAPHEERV